MRVALHWKQSAERLLPVARARATSANKRDLIDRRDGDLIDDEYDDDGDDAAAQ